MNRIGKAFTACCPYTVYLIEAKKGFADLLEIFDDG
jgi:hypothetical protein